MVWPPQCCVPAFLWAAVHGLCDQRVQVPSVIEMKAAATALKIVVSPEDANPFEFPVSNDPLKWGVKAVDATSRFDAFLSSIGVEKRLNLSLFPINEIDFEAYEEVILELQSTGGIVGIGFDYQYYLEKSGLPSLEGLRRGHHLVRLTPIGDEALGGPSVMSGEFGFDYDGTISIFDDSGEMGSGKTIVHWRSLLSAARTIHAALWVVSSS